MVRVSGKAQIDKTGIPRQKDIIEEIREREKLTIADGDAYEFPALSGADVENSPKFRAMLTRLDDPNLAGVVVADISRLFRPEFPDQLAISRPFRVNGKLIYYEDGVLDLRNDIDQRLFVQLAMEAGAHRKQIVKNTHWGKNRRRKDGDCPSDPLPKGVKFTPDGKKSANELVTGHFSYTRDKDGNLDFWSSRMIQAYRRIFAGESQASVARDLKFINPTQLHSYLRSHWWIGEKFTEYKRVGAHMRKDGTRYDGKREKRTEAQPVKAIFSEPPLISRELWEAVQAKLDHRHKTWIIQKKAAAADLEPFLGYGMLRCGVCGKPLHPKPKKNKHSITRYYYCASNSNYNKPCGLPFLRQAEVDREIRSWAKIKLINRKYLKTLAPQQPKTDNTIIEKRLVFLDRRLDNLYGKLGNPDLDDARIERQIEAVQKEKKELEPTRETHPKAVTFDVEATRKRFLHFEKMSMDQQRKALRQTFSYLVVSVETDIDSQTGVTVTRAVPLPRLKEVA